MEKSRRGKSSARAGCLKYTHHNVAAAVGAVVVHAANAEATRQLTVHLQPPPPHQERPNTQKKKNVKQGRGYHDQA